MEKEKVKEEKEKKREHILDYPDGPYIITRVLKCAGGGHKVRDVMTKSRSHSDVIAGHEDGRGPPVKEPSGS